MFRHVQTVLAAQEEPAHVVMLGVALFYRYDKERNQSRALRLETPLLQLPPPAVTRWV